MKEHYNQKWVNRLGACAITFGQHIFYDCDKKDVDLAIRKHEIVHTKQYKKYMILGFMIKYIYEYIKGRLSGLSHWESYNRISLETEAQKGEKDE